MRKSKWDVQFSFQVGTSEVHEVTVQWFQWSGHLFVLVDGVEKLHWHLVVGLKMVRRWELPIGNHEIHQVAIEKQWQIPYSAFHRQTIRAYVDGHLVKEV